MARPVIVYKLVRDPLGTGCLEEVECEGVFHEFGLDFQECNEGVGSFTAAIVESPDGRVSLVPVHLIRFITPTPASDA
jgi:hypothetical protein